jgi:hypothetical protein
VGVVITETKARFLKEKNISDNKFIQAMVERSTLRERVDTNDSQTRQDLAGLSKGLSDSNSKMEVQGAQLFKTISGLQSLVSNPLTALPIITPLLEGMSQQEEQSENRDQGSDSTKKSNIETVGI